MSDTAFCGVGSQYITVERHDVVGAPVPPRRLR